MCEAGGRHLLAQVRLQQGEVNSLVVGQRAAAPGGPDAPDTPDACATRRRRMRRIGLLRRTRSAQASVALLPPAGRSRRR